MMKVYLAQDAYEESLRVILAESIERAAELLCEKWKAKYIKDGINHIARFPTYNYYMKIWEDQDSIKEGVIY